MSQLNPDLKVKLASIANQIVNVKYDAANRRIFSVALKVEIVKAFKATPFIVSKSTFVRSIGLPLNDDLSSVNIASTTLTSWINQYDQGLLNVSNTSAVRKPSLGKSVQTDMVGQIQETIAEYEAKIQALKSVLESVSVLEDNGYTIHKS